jgi:cytoskeletal protein CcmA (bactofilin family)
MMNANSSGRAPAPEPSVTRPEPREPRVEPRAPQPRAAEPRAPEVRMPEAAPRVSVLGPTLRFRGELSAQEDLIIQGSVEGSITHTQSLTVGTDGTMKGDIRARVIVIDGKVEGDMYATESVNIRATAKVKGNVFAPRVGIIEGAFSGPDRDAAIRRGRTRTQCPPASSRTVAAAGRPRRRSDAGIELDRNRAKAGMPH